MSNRPEERESRICAQIHEHIWSSETERTETNNN